MAKENNIVNFRLSPESEQKLEALKKDKHIVNVSAFMNELILSYQESKTMVQSVRSIPEEGIEIYKGKIELTDSVKLYTRPISELNVRRHAEIQAVLEKNGMGYFYFKINNDLSMAIIACNREEASILFQRYYIYDKQQKEYVRTSVPLPQYRYDVVDKNIIIIEYGE